MDDLGHLLTDDALLKLEDRIKNTYGDAAKELQKTIDEYFDAFVKRDAEQQKLLKEEKITEEQYKQWRLAQIGRGKRFEALRDTLAERMTKANEISISYVNDTTPGIYSLNHNYAAYTIEQISGDVDFTLLDEQTVKRLIAEQPDLMPYYPREKAVARGIDIKWGKQQITAQVTSGILQGESLKKLSQRLQSNIPHMSQASALRAARTAVTEAENAGRQASYDRAQEIGLPLRKRWMAVKDLRTRDAHAFADGQTVPLNAPFKVDGYKMMYPGDPSAPPYLVYNCRCTMRTVEREGIEAEPRKMRVRNPATGRNELVSEMTYAEWLEWKKQFAKEEKSDKINKRKERSISNKRGFAFGLRQSARNIITDEEVSFLKKEAKEIDIPVSVLAFNKGTRTGFCDEEGIIHVRGDVFPDMNSKVARDRMSARAVLAHEYYGHYMNDPSEYDFGDPMDEYRASREAALYAPNLTAEDRALLMIDAYDRLREDGREVKYDEEAKKIIYGYEEI